jgi:hypothetical protein
MAKAGLPSTGAHPFKPRIVKNRKNEDEIEKAKIVKGPKTGRKVT